MAAYSTSLLYAGAPGTGPLAFSPCHLCSAAPFTLPQWCPFLPLYVYPHSPFSPSCGLAVGYDSWLDPMGSACITGAPALPFLTWMHMPPPPPSFPMALYYNPALKPSSQATRCSITEIVDDGHVEAPKAEVVHDPFPRSVLMPWRRSAALPPASSGVVGSKPAFDGASNKTSVMISNIPNSFMTKCNKGYAFVNMTTPTAARRLYALLHDHRWAGSAKVCELVHAHIQGVDALAAHFSHSLFPCGNNKEFLPVRFGPTRDGLRQTAERTIGYTAVRRRLR